MVVVKCGSAGEEPHVIGICKVWINSGGIEVEATGVDVGGHLWLCQQSCPI